MLLCPLLATQSATRALSDPGVQTRHLEPSSGLSWGGVSAGDSAEFAGRLCVLQRWLDSRVALLLQSANWPPTERITKRTQQSKGKRLCIWLERSKPKWITTLEWTQSDSANSKTIWIASEHCVILQTDIGIYVEKENQSASLCSCRTVFLTRTREKEKKEPQEKKKKVH